MDLEPIYKLLGKVHEFYPVGMKTLAGYPGEKKIMEIIEKKITAMINEEQTAGAALFNSFKNSTFDYEVVDYSSRQFPCYTMSILYEEGISGDVNRRTEVVFTVSQLCDYYTYFIHDFYRITSQIAISQRRKIYPVNSVSLLNHISFDNIKPIIERGAADIKRHFPQHSYISHLQLFNNKVAEAVPYGSLADYTPTHPYSIYHFLFDGYFAENPFVMP